MNTVVVNKDSAAIVLRRSHPEHGRVLQAYLTETGEKLVSRAHEMVEDIDQRMLTGLDRDERLRLLTLLYNCTASLKADVDKPS